MNKTNTIALLREVLGCSDEELTQYRGVYTYRLGFFYRHDKSIDSVCDIVEHRLSAAGVSFRIIDSGEQWKPWKGGGVPLKKSSHWWVKFELV